MNLLDLTSQQLKRAAAIKDKIAVLNKELAKILGVSADRSNNHRTMSVAGKKKIAAAQKARWAKIRNARSARPSTKPAKKKTMSAAAKAKVSTKMKAYWAAKKARKK